MNHQKASTIHYVGVMGATVLWGVNIVLLKVLVESFAPVTMTAFRILTAGLVLAGIAIAWKQTRKLTKREWSYVLAAGVLGVFAHHLFLSIGLLRIPASTAVLLLGLVPVVTAVCSGIFLRETFTWWKIGGIGLAFVGVLFVQGGGTHFGQGTVYLLIAVLVQAISFIFVRKASETLSAIQVTMISLVAGAIMLFIASLRIEPDGISTLGSGSTLLYSIFLFSAIGSTAAGQLLFNLSIGRIGPSKSALFLNFVPFFGLASSAIFLKEVIYWYQWCGFLFIVMGVLFGTGYVERSLLRHHHQSKKTA
ncbi:DMT family transporter [Alkalicoccobacillus murimartini]|uniref:Drug/metabolite transporter (DMT)-like permease n=1 Tax=Alkalicoccobacillus murimartini TaxID=171685 RepID=A0ABT9YDQ9_9BACI|nr:DMT family transporter [Alkalicoccobacillus murimartini]MDQ0205990.1 drug/metabolite transporter (DMT)-like permease [Alkalicoccobacillus murimartini]